MFLAGRCSCQFYQWDQTVPVKTPTPSSLLSSESPTGPFFLTTRDLMPEEGKVRKKSTIKLFNTQTHTPRKSGG